MIEEKLIKVGAIQATGFLFYITGIFALSLINIENPLIYFLTGMLMLFLSVTNTIYLIFYFTRKKTWMTLNQ